MVQTVVILGGAFGGLHVAHALLKKHSTTNDIKVILVSKNSHFYWNIASVRAIVPGQIKDEDILRPIAPALARYPQSTYEFLVGTATSADFTNNTVSVSLEDGTPRSIQYDQLVLATGANYSHSDVSTPWKSASSYSEILALLHETRDAASKANHITVAGAGATGVEVAGELGYEWGKTKQIVLLSVGSTVMGSDIVGPAATNELKKLNVTIKYDARAVSSRKLESGQTEIALASGETLTTDLYLPTTGMSPNTDYVPPQYVLDNKTVDTDEFLRVKNTTNVWAVGDVVSKPRAGFMITQKQATSVAKNVELALQSKSPVPAKGWPFDILACAVGRGRGAGRAGSVKLPSFGVWLAKGKTMGMPMAAGYIDGSVA